MSTRRLACAQDFLQVECTDQSECEGDLQGGSSRCVGPISRRGYGPREAGLETQIVVADAQACLDFGRGTRAAIIPAPRKYLEVGAVAGARAFEQISAVFLGAEHRCSHFGRGNRTIQGQRAYFQFDS